MAVAEVEAGPAQRTLELTGSFTARRAARLSPRVSGLVAQVAVDAGDSVSRDDVLVRLDAGLAELAVAEARAVVEERRAALAEARRLLFESQRLGEREVVPETEIEAHRSQVDIAAAALARAEQTLATAQEERVRHVVAAPFGGVVAERLVEVGEWVETGTAVVELVDTDALWLDVRAPQRYWSEIGHDAEVDVSVDAVPGRTFEARVHRRVPVNDADARTFLLRLVVDNEGGLINPGMSARVRFGVVGNGDVLRVPRDALIRYPDGTTTVWVVDRDDEVPRAREVAVEVGGYAEDQAEIVDGLRAGAAVIVRGNEVLRSGERVRVVGAECGECSGR
ncbi:MAG: efflux RND transporter periplasmic adaptor subunit [Pseudomonadota bacterium]